MPRNSPIPAVIATRIECGIPLTIILRMPNKLTSKNRQPEMNTAPSAACHAKPMPLTTAYAKYAFSPMPGAIAIG